MTAAPPTAARPPQPDDMLTIHDVLARTQLCKTTIYRRIASGDFPAPLHLGGGIVRWVRREIDAWQDNLARQRTAGKA